MDRPLDAKFKRTLLLKRLILGLAGVGVLAAAFALLTGWIEPSIQRDRIRTAIVERGPVEATINAAGTIVPEHEAVLSSPVDARVLEILVQAGAPVAKGDPIVRLDVAPSQVALEKLSDQLAIKENQQEQVRLGLENDLIDLRSRYEVKELEAKSLETRLEQYRLLLSKGLVSGNDVRQLEVDLERARVEMKQLSQAEANARRLALAKLGGLSLETASLRKDEQEAKRQLELAATHADREGVLTWVTPEVGATIKRGDVIARIADLRSFRVEATVSDIHAGVLATGMEVRVQVGEAELEGVLTRVRPAVENGIIKIDARLEDPSNALLRPNLRADVFIVTDQKSTALRVRRGPFLDGPGDQPVFVIRGQAAVRTTARIGLSNFDYVEVEKGLAEGDEVIISDMSSHKHQKEIALR